MSVTGRGCCGPGRILLPATMCAVLAAGALGCATSVRYASKHPAEIAPDAAASNNLHHSRAPADEPQSRWEILFVGSSSSESSVAPPQTGGETLEHAWSVALVADPRLQAARSQTYADREGLRAAMSKRLPSANVRARYTVLDRPVNVNVDVPGLPAVSGFGSGGRFLSNPRDMFLTSARVAQPLYTFGRIRSSVDSARAELSAQSSRAAISESDIKLEVASAYINVLRTRRILEVAQANETALAEHARIVRARVEKGVSIRNDLLSAEVALTKARKQVLKFDNDLTSAKAAYNRAVSRPFDTEVSLEELEDEFPESDAESLVARALRQRRELGELSAQAYALRRQADSIIATYYPQLRIEGGWDFIQNPALDPESYASVGVIGQWDFFDGHSRCHEAKKLRHRAQALQRMRSDLESAIALEVHQAWLQLKTDRELVSVNRESLRSADENLNVARTRYSQGTGTNLEVQNATALRVETYASYFDSLYAVAWATIKLRRAFGDL